MKIVIVGPRHTGGSIPPYLAVLVRELRALRHQVTWLGSDTIPYDQDLHRFWTPQQILDAASRLADDVAHTATGADAVVLHYGNLETDQLIPALIADRVTIPLIAHTHALDHSLFQQHAPDPDLFALVQEGLRRIDGFVCFGRYAADHIHTRHPDAQTAVSWLPTTIPATTRPVPWPVPGDQANLRLSLYGFAADWKDLPTLLHACELVTTPLTIVLAGPYWHDQITPGHHRIGAVDFHLCPGYVPPGRRLHLIRSSDFAIFPYRPDPAFQGSGAIADYLHHGVPVIATDTANFSELTGDAGLILQPAAPTALATALQRIATDHDLRTDLTRRARRAAHHFRPDQHAAQCADFYTRLTDNTDATKPAPPPSTAELSG